MQTGVGGASAPGDVRNDCSPASIRREVEASLRRLVVEQIDLYQVQRPASVGLCAFNGCGHGPTGYEGPGTSFVTSPSSRDVAEIDFSPAVAPGATGSFSLDGALTKAELTVRTGHLDSGAARQRVYVHGLTETAGNDSFGSLLQTLRDRFGATSIKDFDYYQDKSYGTNGACASGAAPDSTADTVGLPLDTIGNSATICDSAGDLGQNVVKLDQFVRDTYAKNNNKKVILCDQLG